MYSSNLNKIISQVNKIKNKMLNSNKKIPKTVQYYLIILNKKVKVWIISLLQNNRIATAMMEGQINFSPKTTIIFTKTKLNKSKFMSINN